MSCYCGDKDCPDCSGAKHDPRWWALTGCMHPVSHREELKKGGWICSLCSHKELPPLRGKELQDKILSEIACATCNGKGEILDHEDEEMMSCPHCDGSGRK